MLFVTLLLIGLVGLTMLHWRVPTPQRAIPAVSSE
jgi:hypothetical protein